MKINIVNRKYLLGGKWFRYHKYKNSNNFKIAIGKFEFRFYMKGGV